jgi:hypothetical protein
LIWVKREAKYFCKWGWTGNLRDLLVRQNRCLLSLPLVGRSNEATVVLARSNT